MACSSRAVACASLGFLALHALRRFLCEQFGSFKLEDGLTAEL